MSSIAWIWGNVSTCVYYDDTILITIASLGTSSPAVVERPRDASCLSVVTFLIRPYRNLLLLVMSASDLPLRTNKLCSVLLGVFNDVWRSVP